MAYMNQERKKQLAPAILAICKKYGLKASIAVKHHSTLVLNIASGPIDFLTQYNNEAVSRLTCQGRMCDYQPSTHIDVNVYHLDAWTGAAGDFLHEVYPAMMIGNHDKSDIMTDYFDVGWYVDINIGQWDKPYVLVSDKPSVLVSDKPSVLVSDKPSVPSIDDFEIVDSSDESPVLLFDQRKVTVPVDIDRRKPQTNRWIEYLGYVTELKNKTDIVFNGRVIHRAKDEEDAKRIMTEIKQSFESGHGDRVFSELIRLPPVDAIGGRAL